MVNLRSSFKYLWWYWSTQMLHTEFQGRRTIDSGWCGGHIGHVIRTV